MPRPAKAKRTVPRRRADVDDAAPPQTGRDKLIAAVMQLGSTTRSIGALGLREVARQAGLNPNTFYRHFRDFDDLGLAVIEKLSVELRGALRQRRDHRELRGPTSSTATVDVAALQGIIDDSIGVTFDRALAHRAAYVVGIRELHGSSPVLRKALRQVVDGLADDLAEDLKSLLRLPGLDDALVRELSQLVIRQMCFFVLEYLEEPERREGLKREAGRFVFLLFLGAIAAKAPAFAASIASQDI